MHSGDLSLKYSISHLFLSNILQREKRHLYFHLHLAKVTVVFQTTLGFQMYIMYLSS